MRGARRSPFAGDLALFGSLALLSAADAGFGLGLASALPILFIYAILALGLNLVVGSTGLLHLGMAGFFAIGAYTAGILTYGAFPFHLRFGFWSALAAAPIASAVAGFLLGLPILRLRGDYVAIVTLGFGEIVQIALKNLDRITKGSEGLSPVPQPSLLGLSFDSAQGPLPWHGFSLAALALAFWVNRRLEAGSLGRAWRAIREDELAAEAMGIPTIRAKLAAFTIGAAFAGFAGALYASCLTTTAEPSSYNFLLSVMILAMVILGGIGNLRGVLAGVLLLQGFVMVLAPKLAKWLAARFPEASGNVLFSSSNWQWLVFGLVLILVIRFRPAGLIAERPAGDAGAGKRGAP